MLGNPTSSGPWGHKLGVTAGLVPVVPWVGTLRPEPSPSGLATELSERQARSPLYSHGMNPM